MHNLTTHDLAGPGVHFVLNHLVYNYVRIVKTSAFFRSCETTYSVLTRLVLSQVQ